ncbi:hypothetical protein Q7P37_009157 [Cladosporium fusiforme]
MLDQYTYVFAIGTFFALLEAYNNGANDVANAWATSVSSRSVTYQQAMVLCLIFELTGALTVGARTASTIKNGIIPIEAFNGNAGVQLLAFACASAGAATWVMWFGASNVQWGWNGGSGLGAIFAGLCMAPFASGIFGSLIFLLVKMVVHVRKDPVPWAVWTSPFFFLIAGTVCTLSVVYKGSPRLGLNDKEPWYIAAVTLGVGFGLFALSAIFFVPFVHGKVIKKDYTLKVWDVIQGPLLFKRPAPADAEFARVPNYAVVQHSGDIKQPSAKVEPTLSDTDTKEISAVDVDASSNPRQHEQVPMHENPREAYRLLLAQAREQHHAELREQKGPLGWAMRTLHKNQLGAGSIYELHNLKATLVRLPAQVVVGALYGMSYDIHRAQVGVLGTPEGVRMDRVYSHAPKYSNEVEYLYSFVQIITACTASFAHGANDVGNAVGVWAAMYTAWSTGETVGAKAAVPLWQIAVIALTICFGFITYGYNIMRGKSSITIPHPTRHLHVPQNQILTILFLITVMGNKLTYHSPSRGSSMEMGAAITILIFSQYSLPVSTSMCITGATVGVGLCNGTFKAVNWQRVGLLFFSWVMTIPIAGLIGVFGIYIFLSTLPRPHTYTTLRQIASGQASQQYHLSSHHSIHHNQTIAEDLHEHIMRIRHLQTSIARWAIWFNIPFAILYVFLGLFDFLPRCVTTYGLPIFYMMLSGNVIAVAAMMWEMWWNPLAKHAALAHGFVSEQRKGQMLEENREILQKNLPGLRSWLGPLEPRRECSKMPKDDFRVEKARIVL